MVSLCISPVAKAAAKCLVSLEYVSLSFKFFKAEFWPPMFALHSCKIESYTHIIVTKVTVGYAAQMQV